jgi:hypothetical protein
VRRLGTQARLFGHVGERAIPVVVIKRVLAGVGDENVRPPVIVVIAYCDAVAEIEEFPGDAGFGGYVLERLIAFVAKQAVVERSVGFFSSGSLAPLLKKMSIKPSPS